ncbi:hypothetical protein DY000_02029018 [Brassica cretica]|uniref:Uncharacterized protein n=1 Tax=Brassica cretica TaxID=69181 RepID=A0ABQ7DPR8_BRACR|nr:hypothetical protein DY000_02029018 [Brassica cretica]
MVGETQSQLLKENQTLLASVKKVKDQIDQLEKRNEAQDQRPQKGKRRFGDALESGYVEPKPPDPLWITPHQTSYTHEYLSHSYHDYKAANNVMNYSFSGSSWPDDYLSWEEPWMIDRAYGKSPEEVVTNWEDLKDVMIRKPVRPSQGHTTIYDQYQPDEVLRSMEKKRYVSQDPLTRPKEKSDKPKSQAKAMVCPILDKLVYKSSPTVAHDLCPMNKEIPNQKEEEATCQGITQEEVHISQGQKLQEKQPSNTSCPKKKIILQLVETIKNVEIVSGYKEESFKEIPPDILLMLGESAPKMANKESTRRGAPSTSEEMT